MKLLVTGAKGFSGKNLCAYIEANGLGELLPYDRDTDPSLLDTYADACDFVFHLAGVNRPADEAGYEENVTFTKRLLESLMRCRKSVPVLVSSSIQARYDNAYGRSKKRAEELVFDYAAATGAPVYIYRLPGVFGKWCAPNYNSVVATFCHNAARGLPLRVDDPDKVIELAYIDDVTAAFAGALDGVVKRRGSYCVVPMTHHVSGVDLAKIIESFGSRPGLFVPDVGDILVRQLYSTYLSYLPEDDLAQPLAVHRDERGFFADCVKSCSAGQVSVNVARPGVTRGGHWHQTKAETFFVVSGEGVIRIKKPGEDRVYEYAVSGEEPQAVTIPPGYIHEVTNTGAKDLLMLIWASEVFDPQNPDTFAAKMDE
ncbi:MAG: SDR family oxidoreductase [Christensenellaceae bacterium]|nr:SDR family oxidoreductase [Christensenellaceae bacterium]